MQIETVSSGIILQPKSRTVWLLQNVQIMADGHISRYPVLRIN